jgi:hypothetical protein
MVKATLRTGRLLRVVSVRVAVVCDGGYAPCSDPAEGLNVLAVPDLGCDFASGPVLEGAEDAPTGRPM